MTETGAVALVKSYAAEWGVSWQQLLKIEKKRSWWYLTVREYSLTIDTGGGNALAVIDCPTAAIVRFECFPSDPKEILLPFWAPFPTYSSVSSGWRQGCGEPYKYRWHSFYRSLSAEEKAKY